MNVAIVHDYLVNRGGAERVVLALHRMFPDAPIHTAIYHPGETYEEFGAADVRPSFLQRLNGDPATFRRLLPLFGAAFRRMPLHGYDVVISSSAGFAHHVRPSGACHIVYCHAPPRFLWDASYDFASVAPRWSRPLLPGVLRALRRADRRAAARPHLYISNGRVTAKRVREIYGRRSVVVHPPVETARFDIGSVSADGYLMVGRLLGHRNMHLAVEAFTTLGRRLVVVGDGPARADLERIAGPTVEFRGSVPDDELAELYTRCRGVIVPGVEDFGIVPLEANASGKPVIALRAGGALETVADGVNGVLFSEPTADAIARAVQRRESLSFDPRALRSHAERFNEASFAVRITGVVESAATSCIECARHRRADPALGTVTPLPTPAVALEARAAEEL